MVVGMTVRMIAGMTTIDMIVGMIVGTTAGNADKSIGAFVTDWTEGRETLTRTGVPTPITPSIIAVATVIIVKDSAEAISGLTVNMLATRDGNRLIALHSHKIEG